MSGYAQAYAHYSKLKKQFLEQLKLQYGFESEKDWKKFYNNLEIQLSQGVTSQSDEGVTKLVNQLFSDFSTLIKDDFTFNKTKLQSDIEHIKQNTVLKEQEQKQAINQLLNNVATESGINFKEYLQMSLSSTFGGENIGERFEAVLNRANQLVRIYLKSKLEGREKMELFGWPLKSLSGYVREDMSLRGLQQIFQKVKVTPGGAKKVGAKQRMSEMDNILSFVESMDALDSQITVTENIERFLGNYSMHLAQIQYYGEQVKSLELQNLSLNRSLEIANREELKKEFLSQSKGNLSIFKNLQFMNTYKSILTTFRPDTLLFTGKDCRMFMNDFLKSYHEQGYQLQLEYAKDNNGKNKDKITNQVILTHTPTLMH